MNELSNWNKTVTGRFLSQRVSNGEDIMIMAWCLHNGYPGTKTPKNWIKEMLAWLTHHFPFSSVIPISVLLTKWQSFCRQHFEMHFHHRNICIFIQISLNLFLWIQIITNWHWFRQWLGTEQVTSHYMNQWWLNSLTHTCLPRPHCVNNTMNTISFCLTGSIKTSTIHDHGLMSMHNRPDLSILWTTLEDDHKIWENPKVLTINCMG